MVRNHQLVVPVGNLNEHVCVQDASRAKVSKVCAGPYHVATDRITYEVCCSLFRVITVLSSSGALVLQGNRPSMAVPP